MEQVEVPLWMVLTILTAIGGITMFLVNRAFDTLRDISNDVKITNGQIIKINLWTEMHQKQDESWHQEEVKGRYDIWNKLNGHIERRIANNKEG